MMSRALSVRIGGVACFVAGVAGFVWPTPAAEVRFDEPLQRSPDRSERCLAATTAEVPATEGCINLEGCWLLTMPKGFEYRAKLERTDGAGKFRLTTDASNLRGMYSLQQGKLTIVRPENERLTGLVWTVVNKNVLVLTAHPQESQVGSDYRNATLSRHTSDERQPEKAAASLSADE